DSRIYEPPTAGSSLCLAAYICCRCTGPHTRCLCQEVAPMLVKKYGNRRLYDTEESRYVRLDEIADRIRDAANVQAVDAHTNARPTCPGPRCGHISPGTRTAAGLSLFPPLGPCSGGGKAPWGSPWGAT